MLKRNIVPGMKGQEETVVNRMISAAAIKDGLAEVFGTPFLVMLMENAAVEAIKPCLGAGEAWGLAWARSATMRLPPLA